MSGAQTDRSKVTQALWRAVESIGLAPAAILRQARLPSNLHLDHQASASTAQYFALWKAIEHLKPDPALGIELVAQTDTAAHPPFSFAAFFARDYRDALNRCARFKHLCTPEQLRIVESKNDCSITIEWLFATEPEPAILTDIAFASLVELGRRGARHPVTPLRVEFTRSGPKCDAHKAYFGSPIRYGAQRNTLVLKSADLDRPFPGHNPELLEILTPALAAALRDLESCDSITEQVKVVLKRKLASGRPELGDIAQELGMSERTLQRRITDGGSTFRELLIEALGPYRELSIWQSDTEMRSYRKQDIQPVDSSELPADCGCRRRAGPRVTNTFCEREHRAAFRLNAA